MNLGRETETIEFKKSTGELKEGIISICAILNKHKRGELYFGVKNDGTPVGQQISDKTLRDISQMIANHIEPQIFPEITTVNIDGKECILIRFEGYNTPYFAYDIARIRVADEDKTMTQKELFDYIRRNQSVEDSWEYRKSEYGIDDVDASDVEKYIHRGNEAGRINFEYTDKETALKKLLLTNGNALLNAGMVLFCKSIYAELQMAVFAGTERLTFLDIQRHRENIFELVIKAEKYILSNIHWNVEFDGSLQRKEIPEIPQEAIREALINSFCHKDYGACQCNEVAIYKDRIEIYNPGKFPDGYEPADFISGSERPIRRNPLITSILYYSKDVESFGTGLKRIAEACEKADCIYEFKILKSGFVVVFYRRKCGKWKKKELLNSEFRDELNVGNEGTSEPIGELYNFKKKLCSDPESDSKDHQSTPDSTPEVWWNTPDNPPEDRQSALDGETEKMQSCDSDMQNGTAINCMTAKIVEFCDEPRSCKEIMEYCGNYADIKYFRKKYVKPLIGKALLQMTIPDKPNSRYQKYIAVRK